MIQNLYLNNTTEPIYLLWDYEYGSFKFGKKYTGKRTAFHINSKLSGMKGQGRSFQPCVAIVFVGTNSNGKIAQNLETGEIIPFEFQDVPA